jgi:hypothetical protein
VHVQHRRKALRALTAHPSIWVLLGVPLLFAWSGTMVAIRWNAMEMMIGGNLLAGRGPIVAVLDPPALWRPPLGSLLCAAIEIFVRDPFRIFQIVYTASVISLLVTTFYVARKVWGLIAAHAACLFIVTSSAVTSLLIDHGHGLSHVVLLMVIGPALGATVIALERPNPRWMSLAGAAWAVACHARPESAVAVVISGCFLLHASRKIGRVVDVLWFAGAFMVVTAPYAVYSRHVRAHYGIVGPSALTTFYASEAWVNGDGDEDAGFVRASVKYGTTEQHGDSLVVFLWRRPEAGFERVRINVPVLLSLYRGGALFHVAWFVALPFAVLDALGRKRRPRIYLYCLVLFAGSFAVCLFHVDPRYATLGLPPLILILGGGTSAVWEVARRTRRTWVLAMASLCTLVGGAVVGATSLGVLAVRLRAGRYGEARHAIRDIKALAEDFRARRGESRDVLVIAPGAGSRMAQESANFLVSYFAGTGLPWFGQGPYPRDKIFSMVAKPANYAYLPESALHGTDVLLKRRALSAVQVSATEKYYLFDGAAPPLILAHLDEETLDMLGAVLRRNHPGLVDEFEVDRTWAQAGIRLRHERFRAADRVGCGRLALNADGRPDHAFVARLVGIPSVSTGEFIEAISLQRQWPFGVWSTDDVRFVLGVAPRGSEVLVNRPDGSVRIPVEPGLAVRLLACNDGADTPASAYRARLRIGSRSLISVPVTLSEE